MANLPRCSNTEKIKEILNNERAVLHFSGVGGVSMYSLFCLSESCGYKVSGSDRERGQYTDRLIRENKDITIGHFGKTVIGKSLVIRSLAVSEENEEILYARENGILTVSRAEYLGSMMENYKHRIGVSGTHGKSTTTAMIREIFKKSELRPTTLCGADIPSLNSPFEIGGAEYLIYEACEYRDSFLNFSPEVSVFTNLELDHTDYFKSMGALENSFLAAMNIPDLCIVNTDDENLRKLLPRVEKKVVTFGISDCADLKISRISQNCGKYSFLLSYKGEEFSINLSVPGRFNMYNAAAAALVGLEYNLPCELIKNALEAFDGIARRLEYLCGYKGARVYYDYAHHPTEIKATISALREMHKGKITVIFKPHTYSRTASFFLDFARVLSLADRVLLCEIGAIREKDTLGVSSALLAKEIGKKAISIDDSEALSYLTGDEEAIVIMGAASMDTVLEGLQKGVS